jgi:hypothetical protein
MNQTWETLRQQRRTVWGIHGLPKVSLWPTKPYHFMPYGQLPLKWPYGHFRQPSYKPLGYPVLYVPGAVCHCESVVGRKLLIFRIYEIIKVYFMVIQLLVIMPCRWPSDHQPKPAQGIMIRLGKA